MRSPQPVRIGRTDTNTITANNGIVRPRRRSAIAATNGDNRNAKFTRLLLSSRRADFGVTIDKTTGVAGEPGGTYAGLKDIVARFGAPVADRET